MAEAAAHISLTALRQQAASRPDVSAWVSANAGSGKTKVLVDRVLRLLLAGVKPSKILCLTFTKAAAANMSVRIFERLGTWVTMDESVLRADLEKLEGARPAPGKLKRARRLFARAIETPGGLKIETIHAFCERVLHIAPFEANVPANFEVLDDMAADILLAQARREVIAGVVTGRNHVPAGMLQRLALEIDDGLDTIVSAALKERELLRSLMDLAEGEDAPDPASRITARLNAALGLTPADTEESICDEIVTGGLPQSEWLAIATTLESGLPTDKKRAAALRLAAATSDIDKPAAYLDVFLKTDGEGLKGSHFVTKSVPSDLADRMRGEQARLERLYQRRLAVFSRERTLALLVLASAILSQVEREKQARGALDFSDLIERTSSLFARAEAAWVLYKLDAGIDHLLVDEAQDTNPAQWAILKALTSEFRAGQGAREGALPRTIFAVGDPKQSIYGFQGAAPRQFEETGNSLRSEILNAGGSFETVELTVSFRSGPGILSAVDRVFGHAEHYRGLSFVSETTGTTHASARPQEPGIVEIWPLVRPSEAPDPDAWTLPVDEIDAGAPPVRNAQRIAERVAQWIAPQPDGGSVKPGEVLILARSRGQAFQAVIKALKNKGVPVAGADRLMLTGHIAVMDLIAAGRAALLPQDDLNLATVLKSPLVGWSEDDLLRVAAGRDGRESLLATLASAAESGDAMAFAALEILSIWQELAARLGPFAFYATLLGPRGGRRQLIARLGHEAGDAIDTFLARAFAFERARLPSLVTFLDEVCVDGAMVKREMEAQSGEVRVMTVHGAKGLEASHVILIDDCQKPNSTKDPKLFACETPGGEAIPVWSPRKDTHDQAVKAASEKRDALALEEHNRLLYVAMTRARHRLVIAPHIGKSPKEPPATAWSQMIRTSLDIDDPRVTRQDEDTIVWSEGGTQEMHVPTVTYPQAAEPPAWLFAKAPRDAEPEPPLRPSAAGAADQRHRAQDGPFANDVRLVGTIVHALLQHLPAIPAPRRRQAGLAFLRARAARLGPKRHEAMLDDALRIMDDPRLAPLFGLSAMAEVPLAGNLPYGGDGHDVPVSGQVDRLAITDEAVHLVDFKTSSRPPLSASALPGGHVSQIAIYVALLRRIVPDRPVRAYLVYTSGALVHEVPATEIDQALNVMALNAMNGLRGSPAPVLP